NIEVSWVKETPREIRSSVIRQLISNYKTNKKIHGDNFSMKHKSKKDRHQSISILARDWNRVRGEFAFLKNIITSQKLPMIDNT
ncbi:14952_t:CDS:1, partial [Cetraspora pellucida]